MISSYTYIFASYENIKRKEIILRLNQQCFGRVQLSRYSEAGIYLSPSKNLNQIKCKGGQTHKSLSKIADMTL